MKGPGIPPWPFFVMTDAFLPTPDQPGRILVVDDQPDNLRLLSLELRVHPFTLTLQESASEAVALCDREVFDGILMDVHLPGMSGIEACRLIRHSTLNASTPLIFLTANRVGGEAMVQGLEAGGLDYLTKPYSFHELLAKLRMMVRLSRHQRALVASERQQALIQVAGGAAHELSQPLAVAQLMVDRWELTGAPPTKAQVQQLQELLGKVGDVIKEFQNLTSWVAKAYPTGTILDLAGSKEASQIPKPAPKASE